MKYENGKDIFPERLLKQIQKYVSGKLVYIPSRSEKKKDWGEASGYRQYLQKRNLDIQLKFRNGVTIDQLAEEYCLSHETIKKIAYSKKEFSDGLKLFDRYFLGPVKIPLSLFSRDCGPEDGMKWQIPAEPFEGKVLELMEVIKREPDLPPLIVHYGVDGFELNDGNHRYEAYKRLGITEYYVIVWMTEKKSMRILWRSMQSICSKPLTIEKKCAILSFEMKTREGVASALA